MPANPGAKKANEKAKRKREAAQKARRAANAKARANAPQVPTAQETAALEIDDGTPFSPGGRRIDYDELDRLSDEIPTLIKKKDFDAAERLCAKLVRDFPKEPDGWRGFARVAEARGDVRKALTEMERALSHVPPADDVLANT